MLCFYSLDWKKIDCWLLNWTSECLFARPTMSVNHRAGDLKIWMIHRMSFCTSSLIVYWNSKSNIKKQGKINIFVIVQFLIFRNPTTFVLIMFSQNQPYRSVQLSSSKNCWHTIWPIRHVTIQLNEKPTVHIWTRTNMCLISNFGAGVVAPFIKVRW